jgi:poly-gamma-glutamate synthesis protein (capsule biosynthesis protein)
LAVGDIAPDRDDEDSSYAAVAPLLRAADLTFGQCETTFADRGSRLPQARHAVRTRPSAAGALARAGFGVISCAGNHCLDWGNEALLESIGHLRAAGIAVVGAGANIREARAAVHETLADGTRVAFLAYSSILPMNYWADTNRPGCAPLRAHTHYEQIEHDQPGTPASVRTFAHAEDLAALCADVGAAKRAADIVFVSLHWGIHFKRAVLADYQREVARVAIGAGADAILGHHAHILKGAEVIDGKPVFYSLCNFATDLRMDPEHMARKSFNEIKTLGDNWQIDFDSLYNFPLESRMSVIARFEIAGRRIVRTGVLPLYIESDAVPRPVAAGNPRFDQVAQYLRDISAEAGLDSRFTPSGDELVLGAAG